MHKEDDTHHYNGRAVHVGPTRVGKGIFAARPFPAHAVIGEIKGHLIDDAEYGSDYCFDVGDDLRLEPWEPFRYVNHCCEPNCEFDWEESYDRDGQPRRRVYLIALRNIAAGEELSIDYNWDSKSAIACDCRAPSCRGWIVDEGELHELAGRNHMADKA